MFEIPTSGVPLGKYHRGTIEALTDPSQPLRFSVIAALSQPVDRR
jgi:hypothetical protein